MRIAGKVAKLLSCENHLGSAWLISPSHALTAAHCVVELDGGHKPDLTLRFHGRSTQVPVKVDDTETALLADWDVAVLNVITGEHELSDLVIPLSGLPYVRGDRCDAHGHPRNDLEENPNGFTVRLEIINPVHLYTLKQNPVEVIHFSFASACGNLQGLSGAPVFSNKPGHEESAIGIISGHRRDDESNIYAIPILRIAQLSDIIREARSMSHDASRAQRILCIRVTDAHEVSWCAPILPSEVHLLWDKGSPVEQVNCHARLSQIGPADRAVLRLVNHAFMNDLVSPDYESCCSCINKARADTGLDSCPPYPDKPQGIAYGSAYEACESRSSRLKFVPPLRP